VFKERFDGAVKLSLRAKKDIDVQRIAASFGGGGHKKAAGRRCRCDGRIGEGGRGLGAVGVGAEGRG